MNSREKGKVGERAWRDWLREQGYLKAYRGAQYCGLRGNADAWCAQKRRKSIMRSNGANGWTFTAP